MAVTGTAVLDFGAFPGAGQASVAVTGQAAIATSNFCEAWVRIQDVSADHSQDEHQVEQLKITAGNLVAGVGFTIYGECLQGGFCYGKFNVNWVWN